MMNLDPRKMESLMKQLGIKFEEIEDAEEVIIKTHGGKVYRILPQDVKMINANNIKTLQVIIDKLEIEESVEFEINDEDIDIIVEKFNISREDARKILEKHKGDLAEALLELEKK